MSGNEHLREEQGVPYLDGRLADEERAAVERHLAACADCRTRLAELRGLFAVLAEWPAVEPSAGFAAAARARLEAEAQADAPRQAWWQFGLRPAYAGALSAVVLILLVVVFMPTAPPLGPQTPEPIAAPATNVAESGTTSARGPGEESEAAALATLEPVLLENYELLRDFDVLFESARPEPKNGPKPKRENP